MSYDCEIPQYYKWAWHTARKEHECCECDAPILVGESYLQVNACWENRPYTYRQHKLCMSACEFIRDVINDGDCVYYGGLKEEYRNAVKDSWGYLDNDEKDRAKLWKMMLGIYRRERIHEKTHRVAVGRGCVDSGTGAG